MNQLTSEASMASFRKQSAPKTRKDLPPVRVKAQLMPDHMHPIEVFGGFQHLL